MTSDTIVRLATILDAHAYKLQSSIGVNADKYALFRRMAVALIDVVWPAKEGRTT